MAWFAVRSVIRFDELFEERIVLFSEESAEAAMSRAQIESRAYVEALGSGEVLGIQQSYELDAPDIEDATEVFSLMRTSALDADAYLTRHFDTGEERQQIL